MTDKKMTQADIGDHARRLVLRAMLQALEETPNVPGKVAAVMSGVTYALLEAVRDMWSGKGDNDREIIAGATAAFTHAINCLRKAEGLPPLNHVEGAPDD